MTSMFSKIWVFPLKREQVHAMVFLCSCLQQASVPVTETTLQTSFSNTGHNHGKATTCTTIKNLRHQEVQKWYKVPREKQRQFLVEDYVLHRNNQKCRNKNILPIHFVLDKALVSIWHLCLYFDHLCSVLTNYEVIWCYWSVWYFSQYQPGEHYWGVCFCHVLVLLLLCIWAIHFLLCPG